MQFSSLRRVLRLAALSPWLFLPICLLAVDTVWGQPATKPAVPPEAAPKTSTKPPKTQPPATSPQTVEDGNWIFLPGLDGQRIPVPSDLWKDFLRWQATQQAPPLHVTSVSLEGRVVGDHALLDARVEIHVQRTGDWVPVTLRMRTGNTVLASPVAHRGPGESRPDTRIGTADDGFRWWLKGRGLHELSFRLSVPVLQEHPGRRLQLDLPTPAAAGTKLVLMVPGQPLRVSTRDGHGQASSRTGADGTTRIEVHGVGEQVDLSWRSTAASNNNTVLASSIAVAVEPSTDTVVLKTLQLIRVLKGQPETITVDLPEGYELLDVKGDAIQDPQIDPDEPSRVHLPLIAGTTDTATPIEILWTLQGELPASGSQLVLEGFLVEGARYQTGHIAMKLLDNYRSTRKLGRFVHRINVRGLPRGPNLTSLFGEDVTSAWEILRQPFRLEFDLLEIKPRFVAEPHLFLKLTDSSAELVIDIPRAQVFRGAIEALEFHWPDWTNQGWQVATGDSPELEFRYDETNQKLRVGLASRQGSADGRFAVRFRASRPITSDNDLSLTLPALLTPTPPQPILVVGRAINIDTEFTATTENTTRPLSAQLKQSLTLPEELGDYVVPADNYFRLAPGPGSFRIHVMRQPRRISTASSVVANYSDGKLLVTQQVDYNVEYARIGSIRLMVPRPLRDVPVSFRLQADRIAEPIPLEARPGIEVGTQQQIDIQLDEDRLGSFRILADFELPAPQVFAIASVAIPIPLLQSTDAAFGSTRFELAGGGGIDAVLDSASWKSELDVENRPVWRATGSPPEINLALRLSDLAESHRFTVPRVAITQVIQDVERGIAQAWACYHIQGQVTTLALRFSAGARMSRSPVFAWDGHLLDSDDFRQTMTPGGGVEFRLDVSRFAEGPDHLLQVVYHVSNRSENGLLSSRHSLTAPQLAENVHVAETLWQVHFPVGHHLLSGARGHASRFSWQWQTLHFSRDTTQGFERAAEWLNIPDRSPRLPAISEGNSYVFTKYGPPEQFNIRSTSQWSFVLLGAGLALSAGLVLLYIPRTRHALTFLSVGFLVATLSLWLAEPIILLLQPAGLGLALAGLAVFLHHRFGQRPSIDLVSLATTNRLQGSSGEISLGRAQDIQEPSTALHSSPASTPATNPEPSFQLDSGAEG
jgi:hypothetical protein